MSAPVYRSLLEPKLFFGLPYELGLGILILAMYSVLLLGAWIAPPLVVCVIALRFTISIDPFALKLYRHYRSEGDVYVPMIAKSLQQGHRSAPTGKGMLC